MEIALQIVYTKIYFLVWVYHGCRWCIRFMLLKTCDQKNVEVVLYFMYTPSCTSFVMRYTFDGDCIANRIHLDIFFSMGIPWV